MKFSFCPFCGSGLGERAADGIPRRYCLKCRQLFFENPTVGVAAILIEDDRLLLVRRSGSYSGKWCIPCGHVEWGEDIREAARRELKEETGIDAEIGKVFDVHSNFHDPDRQTVGIWFWAHRVGGRLRAGSDAAEARYFEFDALPDEMAFPTDQLVCAKLRSTIASVAVCRLDKDLNNRRSVHGDESKR